MRLGTAVHARTMMTMKEGKDQTTNKQTSQSLRGGCVVLTPSGQAVSGRLLSALSTRGLSVAVVSDEPAVMEQLANGPVTAVILVRPEAWAGLGELAYAIRQHFPATHCWQYADSAPGGTLKLTALDAQWLGPRLPGQAPPPGQPQPSDADRQQSQAEAKPSAQVQPLYRDDDASHAPVGRIMGRSRPVDNLLVRIPPPTNDPPCALISEEELSMLLGPAPSEAR